MKDCLTEGAHSNDQENDSEKSARNTLKGITTMMVEEEETVAQKDTGK